MKFYEDPTYIEMCRGAGEIQEQCPDIADLSSVHPFPVKFFKALSLNLFSRCGDFDDIYHAPEFLCVAHYS